MRRFTAIASLGSAATEARRRNPPMTTTASGELPAGWPRMSLAQAHAALTAPGSPFELETVAIDGREMRVFKHAPPTLREVFLAGRSHGTKDFLVYRDERVDYEAFSRASVTLANALVARGLRKGDRVAIAMRNLPEWPVALFGTLLAGGIATLLNAWWTGPELEYGLTDSGSRFAFVDGVASGHEGDDLHRTASFRADEGEHFVPQGFPLAIDARQHHRPHKPSHRTDGRFFLFGLGFGFAFVHCHFWRFRRCARGSWVPARRSSDAGGGAGAVSVPRVGRAVGAG